LPVDQAGIAVSSFDPQCLQSMASDLTDSLQDGHTLTFEISKDATTPKTLNKNPIANHNQSEFPVCPLFSAIA